MSIKLLIPKWYLAAIFLVLLTKLDAEAAQYFVNPVKGNDASAGTKNDPLKTINEAARRMNSDPRPKATEIILTEGSHIIMSTVVFSNDRFSASNRLTIRPQ